MFRKLSLAVALGALLATTAIAVGVGDRKVVQATPPTSQELVSLGPQPEPPDRPAPSLFDPFVWFLDLLLDVRK